MDIQKLIFFIEKDKKMYTASHLHQYQYVVFVFVFVMHFVYFRPGPKTAVTFKIGL